MWHVIPSGSACLVCRSGGHGAFGIARCQVRLIRLIEHLNDLEILWHPSGQPHYMAADLSALVMDLARLWW
jgi:hypothetical protein